MNTLPPRIIYTFCDSSFLFQGNYADSLIRLQEIFYLYKNEMLDEISDDELLNFMKVQFETVCSGDFDYLESTCLNIFAQAIRAGYKGCQASQGMEELIPIFSKLAQDYTGFESTSISYERAQSLMEAVIYCLDEYHQVPSAIPETSHISIEEKYELGLCLVKEKEFKIRNIFNELCLSFQDFGVKCLCDTIKSIPEFLKWYNAKFCPQENIITVDYPLLIGLSSLRGADKIYQYILFLQKEQQFLTMFHKNYVIHIL